MKKNGLLIGSFHGSAVTTSYTAGEVTGALHGIFDAQYGIVLTETEETRTKLETKTRWEKKTRIEEREGVRLLQP